MVRTRLEHKFITQAQLLTLNRDGLAKSGLAVAEVSSRNIDTSGAASSGTITLKATSESDPTKTVTAVCKVSAR